MANPDHEREFREAAKCKNSSADLSGYDLSGTRFPSPRLEGVNLSGADLRGADLPGGYFRACNLSSARISKAQLSCCDLRDADLTGADLTGTHLTGATLNGAKLAHAKLVRANLVKARLNAADLTGTDLDRADLRGAQGLTESQLSVAANSHKAILDERMLAAMQWTGDVTVARHGRPSRKRAERTRVDLTFATAKPTFGDVFLLCGDKHPQFPPTGSYGFDELTDLGIEQMDDYFAICVDGDPVVWIYPLVAGHVVQHHPGPFDGLRFELAERNYMKRWSHCVARFRESLQILSAE